MADSEVHAGRHGDPRGKVVPLHSTATWQRGDGVMDYKHQSHSQQSRPPCDHQCIQERLRVGRDLLDVSEPLSEQ